MSSDERVYLRERLIQSLHLTELSFSNRHEINQWLKDGKRNPLLSENEARDLLHRIYQILCEQYGPVRSDTLLSRSVAQADKLLSGTGVVASKLL